MNMNEEQPNFESSSETMKLPEIMVGQERGVNLLSLLLKGYDVDWGGQVDIAKEVEVFFQKNPLNKEAAEFLKEIRALKNDGIHEDVLYHLALTMDNPKRIDAVVDFIKKYKNNAGDLQKLRDRFITILNEVDESLPNDLRDKLNLATLEDIKRRNMSLEEIKRQFEDSIDFFRPSAKTTRIKKIIILPTDFMWPKESGMAFIMDSELFLLSNVDNPGNLKHEFLHSIINPIIDKLSEKLTDDQKLKISRLGSNRLRVEEEYGDGYFSLLAEEFIRVYNNTIETGEAPASCDSFLARITAMSESKFTKTVEEKGMIKKYCVQYGIKNLREFKNKSEDFYNRFMDSELGNIVYAFYQKYIEEKKQNSKIHFEKFVLSEFPKEID